jgi:radical SAM superfamily enzyme YgiQ (UPF0313 family)
MKNKNLLIIIPRWNQDEYTSEPSYSYMFPMGIPYLCAAMKKDGIPFDVLNLNTSIGIIETAIQLKLREQSYSIVATGANSIYYNQLNCIIKTVKAFSEEITTVLGGIIVSTKPELIMNAIHPDYGLSGDCDYSFPKLVRKINSGTDCKIGGLLFWNSDKTLNMELLSGEQECIDLDSLPFPDFESCDYLEWLDKTPSNNPFYFHIGPYDYPRVYPIMGSRGCPYHCTFCYHTNKYLERSLNSLFSELETIIPKYNITHVFLYDDCFLNNSTRVNDFCDRFQLLRECLKRDVFYAIQGIVSTVNEKLLLRLKETGCVSISYGFESYSASVLKSMKKPIFPEQIDSAYRLTRKAGMNVQASFIFGDSAETVSTYKATLDYWKNTCANQVSLAMVTPYPNSEIYQKCLKRKVISDELAYLRDDLPKSPRMNFTDNMSCSEYKKMARDIDSYLANYCPGTSALSFSKSTVADHHFQAELRCPVCHKVFKIDNLLLANDKCRKYYEILTSVICKHCLAHILLCGKNYWLYCVRYKIIPKIIPEGIKKILRNIINVGLAK